MWHPPGGDGERSSCHSQREKGGDKDQCFNCPQCSGSITQQLGNETQEKKHKDKAEEEQLEAGRKKQKSCTARWHLVNAWGGGIVWEAIDLVMVKMDSFLSVGLCRFLEFGE